MIKISMKKILFNKLHLHAQIPAYQTAGASGFDFHSVEDVTLKRGEVALVSTGLAVEVPEAFELQIRARSGLAAKKGVFLVNGIGTIDSDYRGEIKIILSTCSDEPVVLKAGDRIAQGVVMHIEKVGIEEAEFLTETDRGEGGFGSTGLTEKSPSYQASPFSKQQ